MKDNKLVLLMAAILLFAFTNAHAGSEVHSAEKIEYGKSGITYRVDKDVHKLIGKDVVNNKGDALGTVENFLISNPENIQYAIISVGGFLGIGDKLVAVPVKNLQMNKEEGNVSLNNVTGDELKNAPAFEYEKAESGTERFPEYGPSQH
ncbi:PRC-barrel domain-containing protein [Nitrosomonas sp. Nm51]|uniref:PRC-barrel domain-containing protein n=1 Tax=Nitrosomonas sp. Nm51 TaxID=133720 RepID=UPI0008BEA9D8|nr:PRC-barrel domain-containing protein [Nitrosomonas sp. Nm51]SEQ76228.1 PRC-barrel domain-containing protein [Nitrosomonas sp. Nm51]